MNISESQNPEEINIHRQIWGESELSTVVETTNRRWQKTTRDVHFVILELRNLNIARVW
ncbi:MAG TPA: hypothetical protein VF233_00540 [Nitrososphaeraceae archaeon]